MSSSADKQTRDLLDDLTARLQNGESIDPALAHAATNQDDVQDLLDIIQSLHALLTPQAPREDFANRLRRDLLEESPGFVVRIRQMPPRVRLAALLAVFAGCGLLMLASCLWLRSRARCAGRGGRDSPLRRFGRPESAACSDCES